MLISTYLIDGQALRNISGDLAPYLPLSAVSILRSTCRGAWTPLGLGLRHRCQDLSTVVVRAENSNARRYRASGTERPILKSFRSEMIPCAIQLEGPSVVRVLRTCTQSRSHLGIDIDCIIPTLLAYQLTLEHGFMASLCMPACYSTLSGINRRNCMLTRSSGKERYFSIQRAPERNTQLRSIMYSVTLLLLLANNNSPTRVSMSSLLRAILLQ